MDGCFQAKMPGHPVANAAQQARFSALSGASGGGDRGESHIVHCAMPG
jgi:hypothetical protein